MNDIFFVFLDEILKNYDRSTNNDKVELIDLSNFNSLLLSKFGERVFDQIGAINDEASTIDERMKIVYSYSTFRFDQF